MLLPRVVIAGLFLSLVAPEVATAERAINQPIRVKLRSLDGRQVRDGRFLISYELRRRSWRRIQRSRIPAQIHIYTQSRRRNGRVNRQFRWAAALQRDGKVWLNRDAWNGWDRIEIEIHGAMGDAFINGVVVNGRFDRSWGWALSGGVAPPPPVPPVPYTKLLSTCNRQFIRSGDRQTCISIGKKLPGPTALATIATCSRQYIRTNDRWTCMRGGIGWAAGAAYTQVVGTCAKHYIRTNDRFTCHKLAAGIRSRELIKIIGQCARSYVRTNQRFACMRQAR